MAPGDKFIRQHSSNAVKSSRLWCVWSASHIQNRQLASFGLPCPCAVLNSCAVIISSVSNRCFLSRIVSAVSHFDGVSAAAAVLLSPLLPCRVFGWTEANEIGNGRWVMFGVFVGLLTEYATGVDFPNQLRLMLSYLGIVDMD